jgi:hypothetical protein
MRNVNVLKVFVGLVPLLWEASTALIPSPKRLQSDSTGSVDIKLRIQTERAQFKSQSAESSNSFVVE